MKLVCRMSMSERQKDQNVLVGLGHWVRAEAASGRHVMCVFHTDCFV